MNFHLDDFAMPCCVLSVEQREDGGCGEIRIVCANKRYKETMGPAYYDNMPYYELVPQDNKFEDYCFQSAVNGRRMHAYVETRALGCWTDQTMIPLEYKEGNIHYCQFFFEFTRQAESQRMASVSMEAAEAVISACIRLMGREDFHACMNDVTEEIRNASGAKDCRIMTVDHEKKEALILCENAEPGYWPEHDPEDDIITYELMKSWESAIGVSNELIIKNEQDMEELAVTHPVWAASMRENGVESLIISPLRRERVIIGYLYVVNYDVEKTVPVKEMIELLAFFLGIWISNHQLIAKLEEISSIDALTGLNNRRSMVQRIDRLAGTVKPCGVVNLDLNGLKLVNDRDGHEAGDRLLVRVGELLRKVFYDEDVYRTGGDEFIVIIEGISEAVFERKIGKLREAVEKYDDVSFAIGTCWSDGHDELAEMFRIADKRMYDDKLSYYRRNCLAMRREFDAQMK